MISQRDRATKAFVLNFTRALSDYKKGKSVSLFGFMTKAQLLLVKLLPVPAVMKVWTSQQKLKNRD